MKPSSNSFQVIFMSVKKCNFLRQQATTIYHEQKAHHNVQFYISMRLNMSGSESN